MARKSLRQRIARFITVVAVGGSVFQLSGCDPNVRSTLLTGLQTTSQSLGSALISAFFLTLEDDNATSTGLTTT